MQRRRVCFIFLITVLLCKYNEADHVEDHPLRERLRTWDTISENDIVIKRHRRSASNKVPTFDREVSFNAFHRRFTLSLISSPEVLAPDFYACVRGRSGSREMAIDKSSIYTGTVIGERGSLVKAHLEDKTLMATITTKDETYVVEPSWRHLPLSEVSKEENKKKMIVYKQSDLNFTRLNNHLNGYCDVENLMKDIRKKKEKTRKQSVMENHVNKPHYFHENEKNLNRHKREGPREKRAINDDRKICSIALVADYRFFKYMGNNNVLQTIYYLITLFDKVNQIFKNVNWDVHDESTDYVGYGFQISNITVFNESTANPRYNAPGHWDARELLEAFSEINHGHCLAHLFTYVDFPKGVLGLAYVGDSEEDNAGGICTKPYLRGQGNPTRYLNTGLTTTVNWGQRILTMEADLVTTHELGHNFGAEHDNGEAYCSPGEENDGNFIMYPAAVSGNYPNNKRFSNCSKNNVLRCLKAKAKYCFQRPSEVICGNFKVEVDEECDPGYLIGRSEEDLCCSQTCKLKSQAKCSYKNQVCCNEFCQAASKQTICYSEVPDSCLRDTFCDGVNFTCPNHLHKKDDEPCGDIGKCSAGVCLPFCVTVGMKPCLCSDKKENFCQRCCAPIESTGSDMATQCVPYLNGTELIPLRDNSKCILGYCKDEECIKQTQDVIERVWSIFENIAPDKIGEFLADNIVGAVLVFSILFWVPCGCLVNFVDKKREKQRKTDEEWFTEKGSQFSRPNAHGSMFGSTTGLNKVRGAATKTGLAAARENWRSAEEKITGRRLHDLEPKLPTSTNDKQSVNNSNNGSNDLSNSRDSIPVAKTFIDRSLLMNRGLCQINEESSSRGSSRSCTPRPQLKRQDHHVDVESPT